MNQYNFSMQIFSTKSSATHLNHIVMNYFTHAMIHYALLLFIIFRLCTCLDTISIKTNPIRDTDNTVLVSSGKTFALGFFGKPNYRYVGIWYHTIPGQTVVWVANRDNPITDSSGFLSIDTTNGNLVLYHNSNINQTDDVVWSANASSSACSPASDCVAQLLDSGNLVLLHNINKQVIWQSFDHPTNTMLPNMKLGIDRRTGLKRFLTSWKSEDDPGIGNYSYSIDPSGSPHLILYKGQIRWWRSGPWNGMMWNGVPASATDFNASFVNDNNEISQMWDVLDSSIFSRIVVNESGMVQLFIWYEGAERRWNELWSAPTDRCDKYGHCSAFGLCDTSTPTQFECTCLPGYEPRSPTEWYMRDANHGCVRKPGSLICRKGEGFVKLANVKVPDTSRVEVISSGLSLKACEKECLRNCNCTAYARANISEKGSGCILWHGNLIDTRKLTAGDGQDLYVRVNEHDLSKYTKKSKRLLATILIVSVVSVLFSIIFFAYWFLKRKRKGQHNFFLNDNITSGESSEERNLAKSKRHLDLPFFDLRTLITATDNFSVINKLGQGGFGSVYKGQLVSGQEIAVKRLSKYSGQGMQEFKNEVTVIAKLQHRNLVGLLGCCIHKDEKMLIYEYLPNKSLDYFIFDARTGSNLDWTKRFEIVIGIARGILYLHQDSRLKIIHRDLKASNVLLDSTMNPKISDFGMARMFNDDQIQARTKRVVGTYGYMSPEYAMQGLYSTKSDVFSFGVLLLEIITGRKNTDYINGSPFPNLIGHMWELWKEGRVLDIVDPTLCQPFSAQDEVSKCIHIGLLCVQEGATDRPTMSEVISMLTNDTTLPPPNTPAFIFQQQTSHDANSSTSRSGEAVSLNSVTITILEAR
ncbi:G-type lectin S-receptor-like serine/threonine-protein kinase RKS1 isoform X1 [Ziziphus jujuba]|uniref:Receptor-like serine/threonine-protein kinase n=1 Tax=Ziziphus jujuba TaxID=326968 RepID=A0ABM3I294_ZIZJJ|nr:G-type lectin S-receptor-like serine/threonine-protein kinase RKS1 isoform X1 [Ziziphus jujuba]